MLFVCFSKIDQGPQSHRFRNNRLPSAFNVEVEGAVVEVVKHFNSRNSRSKARVFSFFVFEAFNLFIKESYASKGIEHDLLAPHTSGPRDVPRCGALSLL